MAMQTEYFVMSDYLIFSAKRFFIFYALCQNLSGLFSLAPARRPITGRTYSFLSKKKSRKTLKVLQLFLKVKTSLAEGCRCVV